MTSTRGDLADELAAAAVALDHLGQPLSPVNSGVPRVPLPASIHGIRIPPPPPNIRIVDDSPTGSVS